MLDFADFSTKAPSAPRRILDEGSQEFYISICVANALR
jgi:hypothetical protein